MKHFQVNSRAACTRWRFTPALRGRAEPSSGLPGLLLHLRLRTGIGLLQQIVNIKTPRVHRQLAVRRTRPLLLRPIPIELDAIVIWVAQIECLAHAVVGGAVERNLRRDQAAERIRQNRTRRIENCQMVEAGGARLRRPTATTFPSVETDMMVVAASRDEGGL